MKFLKGASQVFSQSFIVLTAAPSLFLYSLLSALSSILIWITILGSFVAIPSLRDPILEDINVLGRALYLEIKHDSAEKDAKEALANGIVLEVIPGPTQDEVFAQLKAPSLLGCILLVTFAILMTPISKLGRSFFLVALLYGANQVFQNKSQSIGANLAQAFKRLPAVCGWLFIAMSATIMRDKIVDRLWIGKGFLRSLTGVAGRSVTVFVLPAIATDDLGPMDAIQKSAECIRKVWGEGAAIAVALSPFGNSMILLDGGILVIGILIMPITLLGGIILILLGLTLMLIYRAVIGGVRNIAYLALYRYAIQGTIPIGFEAGGLQAALAAKQ